MQCVSCQFFNVPGSLVCGRCGTTLRFDQLNVATAPPRAPKHGRWLRNLGLGWLIQSREVIRSARVGFSGEAKPLLGDDAPPLQLFVQMLVPGWALRRVGAVAVGWLALALWVLLLLLTVLFLGWQLGGLFLGLAFAVHYISGLAAVRIAGFDRVYTFRLGALIAVTLLVTFYIPGPWLVQQVVQPVEMNRTVGPFHSGDVVLYAPLSGARSGSATPGQWVVFDVPNRLNIQVGPRNVNAIVQPGQYLAQVIGRPGDRLDWDGTTLRVNGEPAVWQPGGRRQGGKPQHQTVPGSRYLVAPWAPDVIEFNNGNYPDLQAGPLNLTDPTLYVDFSHIDGRVFFKLHPLTEMGRVR